MNERRKIEERLRKKEEEIREFEVKIRDARIYVQALQDVLKILPRGSERNIRGGTLRPGSSMARANDGAQPRNTLTTQTSTISWVRRRSAINVGTT